MQLEAARLVAAALAHATYGVNAKLLALGLDGTDARPAPFGAGNLVEETSDPRAALRQPEAAAYTDALTELFPALLVRTVRNAWKDGEWAQLGQRMDTRVTVLVRLALLEPDPAVALQETYYRLAAVEQCLRAFSTATDADRTRNSVRLITLEQMEDVVATQEVSLPVTGGVQTVWYATTLTPI